jgi:hypothetical protein
VGHHDGQRHQLFGFIARIPEHEALIPCAACVYTHGDIRRLRLDHVHHRTGLRVKAHGRIGVADLRNHSSHQLGNVHVSRSGDFTGNNADTGGDQGFAGYATVRVIRQHGIENSIGNLISDFVRVAFRHGF